MKKRKWYLWAIVLAFFAIGRYVLLYEFMMIAKEKRDYAIAENYVIIAIIVGMLCFIVCTIGLFRAVSKIFGDLKTSEQAKTRKYFFLGLPVWVILKDVFDVAFVSNSEIDMLELCREIEVLNGLDPTLGHPSGILTIGSLLICLIQILFFLIYSIAIQIIYWIKQCK